MKIKNTLFCLSGSFILAFGLYHVHSFSRITEGGALGMTLLLQNCFSWSPALTGPVINLCCYALGIRTLGKDFLKYSLIATVGFSVFFSRCGGWLVRAWGRRADRRRRAGHESERSYEGTDPVDLSLYGSECSGTFPGLYSCR